MGTLVPRLLRRNKIEREPVWIYVLLTVLGTIMVLPLYLMVIQSIKPIEELFLWPPRFYVMRPTLENYTDLLVAASRVIVPFSRYIFNSVFVTTVNVIMYVLFCCMAAYPIAKMRQMPLAGPIFSACIAALMFAPQVTVIPRYLLVSGLGMVDTYYALILPGLGSSFGVFFMTQFLQQYPDAMIEAARIDGASEWGLFQKVVVPLTKPAWATLIIWQSMQIWRDTWSPMVFAHSEAMKTVPLAVRTMFSGELVVARQGAQAAATFLETAPLIILFIIMQSRIIKTMAHAGIK